MPPVPKPTYKRRKPTRKQRGAVNKDTYNKVLERDNYSCIRCGRRAGQLDKYGIPITLELAHIENKSQGGTGEADNLATLCGPSVNTGTCHNWVDYTKEGKEWLKAWAEKNKGGKNGDI